MNGKGTRRAKCHNGPSSVVDIDIAIILVTSLNRGDDAKELNKGYDPIDDSVFDLKDQRMFLDNMGACISKGAGVSTIISARATR